VPGRSARVSKKADLKRQLVSAAQLVARQLARTSNGSNRPSQIAFLVARRLRDVPDAGDVARRDPRVLQSAVEALCDFLQDLHEHGLREGASNSARAVSDHTRALLDVLGVTRDPKVAVSRLWVEVTRA